MVRAIIDDPRARPVPLGAASGATGLHRPQPLARLGLLKALQADPDFSGGRIGVLNELVSVQ
jgi:hypothetical protein